MQPSSTSSSSRIAGFGRWRWASVAALSLAMLIWAKLRIVTGVPRAVYADPNQTGTTPNQTLNPNQNASNTSKNPNQVPDPTPSNDPRSVSDPN